MRSHRAMFHLLLLVALFAAPAFAQTSDLQPDGRAGGSAPDRAPLPTVSFTFDWPELKPPHYVITVESSGRASFTALDDPSKPADPYTVDFQASAPTRERIFTLARSLDHFTHDLDYRRHKIAFTGQKTLGYADAERRSQTSFNWSENPQAMEMVHIFQAIANTLNSGRRLEYLRRFDRLGLNAQLREMELNAKDGYLAEVQAIAPLLRRIADDPAVMDLARQRARRLLLLVPAEP